MLEICIYNVNANSNTNKYHLVLYNTVDNTKSEFIASARSQEELYQIAFDTIDKLRKSNLLVYIDQKQKKLKEQEEISLGLGKGYRKLKDQERATYYFSRANDFFRQRNELDQEVAALISSNISNITSLNPIHSNSSLAIN